MGITHRAGLGTPQAARHIRSRSFGETFRTRPRHTQRRQQSRRHGIRLCQVLRHARFLRGADHSHLLPTVGRTTRTRCQPQAFQSQGTGRSERTGQTRARSRGAQAGRRTRAASRYRSTDGPRTTATFRRARQHRGIPDDSPATGIARRRTVVDRRPIAFRLSCGKSGDHFAGPARHQHRRARW